jgi:hypothetical protein
MPGEPQKKGSAPTAQSNPQKINIACDILQSTFSVQHLLETNCYFMEARIEKFKKTKKKLP